MNEVCSLALLFYEIFHGGVDGDDWTPLSNTCQYVAKQKAQAKQRGGPMQDAWGRAYHLDPTRRRCDLIFKS